MNLKKKSPIKWVTSMGRVILPISLGPTHYKPISTKKNCHVSSPFSDWELFDGNDYLCQRRQHVGILKTFIEM